MRISAVLVSAALFASCSTSAQQAKKQTATDVVATVGTTPITLAQVDDLALQQPASSFGNLKLSQAMFEARRMALDSLVGNLLVEQEAKARGMDKVALVDQEISSKIAPPTDEEVAAWYQANQQRVQGATLDQVRAPIRAFLVQERTQAARQAYLDRLKAKTPVKMMLEPPRQAVKAGDSPAKGTGERADRAHRVLGLPVPVLPAREPGRQPGARHLRRQDPFRVPELSAAEPPQRASGRRSGAVRQRAGQVLAVSRSAVREPGPAERRRLETERLPTGSGQREVQRLLRRAQIQGDRRRRHSGGDELGVSGTPAFFINGRAITGAQPFEEFKRIIDEELELKKTR